MKNLNLKLRTTPFWNEGIFGFFMAPGRGFSILGVIVGKAKIKFKTQHPAYTTWKGMIRRCYNPKHKAYKNYGGRGIFVCDQWREDPFIFFRWMENNGWMKGLQIDRIDNNRGYFPGNCRLVPPIVNLNNSRQNRKFMVDGECFTISQASRRFGVNFTTIKYRMDKGLDGYDLISPPREYDRSKTPDIFFIDGEKLTLAQISKKYNLKYNTVRERVCRGWVGESIVRPV